MIKIPTKLDSDERKRLLESIGPLDGIEVFNNQVLVAVYIRPEKSAGGVYFADQTKEEDKWQGKVGLILKMGPTAFDDPDGKWFQGVKIELNDWVMFRPSDGWSMTINKNICRLLDDTAIRGRVQNPQQVY